MYYLIAKEKVESTCPHCGHVSMVEETLYDRNITHNLNKMAEAAGIYKHLWRPDEIGVTLAGQLIEPLKMGLEKLKGDPQKYSEYNASNGWGLYEHFVPWVEDYLNACIENPTATIKVST